MAIDDPNKVIDYQSIEDVVIDTTIDTPEGGTAGVGNASGITSPMINAEVAITNLPVVPPDVLIVADQTVAGIPTGLAVTANVIDTSNVGNITATITLGWNANSETNFQDYQVRYKKTANTYYTYVTTTSNTLVISGLLPNTSYDFALQSITKFGIGSAYSATVTVTSASNTSAPATVASVTATAGIQYVIVERTGNTEADITEYTIYRNTTNSSATAVIAGTVKGKTFIDGGRTGGTLLYYWVKAKNTSGLTSANFSTVASATPRNVENADVLSLGADKVLINGVVYLSDWQKTGDLTKIDGGEISTNTITTTQLNFTPVQGTDVIASINASAEGIKIDADNITINGNTTFGTGYDPTTKVKTFAQDGIPTSISAGDIRVDTNDGNKLYRAEIAGADEIKAGEWILVQDQNKTTTFAQDGIPTSTAVGDLWFDTNDSNKCYRAEMIGADAITAGEWVEVPDNTRIATGGAAADINANTTTISGGKITTGSIDANRLVLNNFMLSAGTFTSNSPTAGKVAWSGCKVVYKGAEYTITDGASTGTTYYYIYRDLSSPTAFSDSVAQPAVQPDRFVVCLNKSGTATQVWNGTIIDGAQITTGTIAATAIVTGALVVGTNVGQGTAVTSSGVTTIIGDTVTTGYVNALSITAGSVNADDITAGTITGSTLQTDDTGKRVVVDGTNNLITFYNTDGVSSGQIVGGKVGTTEVLALSSTGYIYTDGTLLTQEMIPLSNNSYDIGGTALGYRNIYMTGVIDFDDGDGQLSEVGGYPKWSANGGSTYFIPMLTGASTNKTTTASVIMSFGGTDYYVNVLAV